MAAVDPTIQALLDREQVERQEYEAILADIAESFSMAQDFRARAVEKLTRISKLRDTIDELGGEAPTEEVQPPGELTYAYQPDVEPKATPKAEPEPAGPGWLLDDDELEPDEQEVPDPEPVEEEPDEPKDHGFTGKRHGEVSAAFRDWVVANKGITFTPGEAARAIGLHPNTTKRLVKEFLRTGLIEEDRERKSNYDTRTGGAKTMAYKYRVKKDGPKSRREVSGGPAVDVGLPAPRRKGKAPTGRKPKISDPETRKLVDTATRAGWTASNGGSHLRLESPQGRVVVVSKTPSDHRAVNNTRAELRRAGLEV